MDNPIITIPDIKPKTCWNFDLYSKLIGIKTKMAINTMIPPTKDIIAASIKGFKPTLIIK